VGEFDLKLSASPAYGNADTAHICTAVGEFEGDGASRARIFQRSAALIQNTSASESALQRQLLGALSSPRRN